MVDITSKIKTHRIAIAQATVTVSRQETIAAINNRAVPKGDVLEASRVAGLLGIKKTSDLIPDCHPLPIEFAKIKHSIDGLDITAAVIVCSDSIAAGKKQDAAGKAIIAKLEKCGIENNEYCIIPDEVKDIQQKVGFYCNNKIDIIILTGGTGLSPRDVTPEAIRPMLDREIPGIGEAARGFGQEITPYSMLSRSLGGLKGNTLILALPGSTKGAAESMDALFPYILHLFKVMEHLRHEEMGNS